MKIIAELGLFADGSLGNMLCLVDACANAGADIIKGQCHAGDPVSVFRPNTFLPQDRTRQDFWKRTGFTHDEWERIIAQVHRNNKEFCVSVFSHEAIDLLQDLPVDYWKLGSAQTSDLSLIERLAAYSSPLILSSGMSDWKEMNAAVLAAGETRPTILHCVSEYPTPPEHVGLNILEMLLRDRYDGPAGLSDHSGTIWPSLIAASMGADYAEVHVCWHRECFGADVPASITIDELKQLVQGVRFVERMTPVDKDEQAKSMEHMRRLFRG